MLAGLAITLVVGITLSGASLRVGDSSARTARADSGAWLSADPADLGPLGLDEVGSVDLAGAGPRAVAVPVLMYHYIRINPVPTDRVGWNLSVTPENFAAQMDLIDSQRMHPITLAKLDEALTRGAALPPRPVVLTFDDGYSDFATVAAPILARHGFVATAFVVSGFIGRPNYMSADQIRSVRAMGMVIGAHTVHHVALAHVASGVAVAEIVSSRQQLEALLRTPVLDFAYPYGDVSPAIELMVADAGFRDAVTTQRGTRHDPGRPFAISRLHVGGDTGLGGFARSLGITAPPGAALALAPPMGGPTPRPSPRLIPIVLVPTPWPSRLETRLRRRR